MAKLKGLRLPLSDASLTRPVPPYRWQVGRGRCLLLDHTLVMGILNVTPDSFSDGNTFYDLESAVDHGLVMAAEGAEIIDVGGESTRPGAVTVPEEEELRRVIPVIKELVRQLPPHVQVSIDTRKARVAEQALAAGASIINDVSGLQFDPRMLQVLRESDAGVVIMHMRGTPQDMQQYTQYDDVVAEVCAWLEARTQWLVANGVARERIVIDPGFGFSKNLAQNLELLRRLPEFQRIGRPVLVGTSRKSMIGQVLGLPVSERLEGTVATVVLAVAAGADIVRVHDVLPAVRACRMTDAVVRGMIRS
ncbi:MAG: dihydropteroate synthase [Limnochordales bacterium]|nr:dihydropteroate synthase [Limnochordales bacterium]